ncbi:hypothetical protein, partial [Salmonella enterica]|uniref:hypothetical protein n=1 Tax=Salmonella enterica TaxID=28901 RepID=UPI003526430D
LRDGLGEINCHASRKPHIRYPSQQHPKHPTKPGIEDGILNPVVMELSKMTSPNEMEVWEAVQVLGQDPQQPKDLQEQEPLELMLDWWGW